MEEQQLDLEGELRQLLDMPGASPCPPPSCQEPGPVRGLPDSFPPAAWAVACGRGRGPCWGCTSLEPAVESQLLPFRAVRRWLSRSPSLCQGLSPSSCCEGRGLITCKGQDVSADGCRLRVGVAEGAPAEAEHRAL